MRVPSLGLLPQGVPPAICGILLLLVTGCETVPKEIYPVGETEPPTLYSTVSTQHGKASYYAGRWIGRKTANGEIYRAADVTAAHKTLPFNTMVRVTNQRNGKSVIVRINNRGPYIRGRIIDLSWEAAKAIDMVKAGVVPVKVEVLREISVMTDPNLKLTDAHRRANRTTNRQSN
jgi:rare lipoprotein A